MNAVTQAPEEHVLATALQQRLQASNISRPSLVFTFFCDVITQHGEEVWLGHVIQTLAPLKVTERSIRTAVYRLIQDGWLLSRKQGRRSFYRLSETGQRYYQRAARRIYSSDMPSQDGPWVLLFVAMVPEDKRDILHRGLAWLGYGRLATAVYALPGNDREPLLDLLTDLGIEDNIVHMLATSDSSESLKKLLLSHWNLSDFQQRYTAYTEWLAEVYQILENHHKDPHLYLLLRVLLIHEYRKILLADPELPAGMLPPGWQGESAKLLTADIYRRLYSTSTKWFEQQLQAADGISDLTTCALEHRFTNIKAKQ